MLGAVVFGHEQMQVAISAIQELADEVGKPAWDWQAPAVDEDLDSAVAEAATSGLSDAGVLFHEKTAPRRDMRISTNSRHR